MSRFHSYINTASLLLEKYKGDIPFAVFSRQFFATHKKYGSKDRKQITHCCYCFFRTGHLLRNFDQDKKIIAAVFICSTSSNALLENLAPEWNALVEKTIEEKSAVLQVSSNPDKIFPWNKELSDDIDGHSFTLSLLQQPDLFLRVRPGQQKIVEQKLNDSAIAFRNISSSAIALLNGTKIEDVIDIDKDAVVQDLNSQRTADLLLQNSDLEKINCWDCCVASGGKSILLYDQFNKKIELTVSDIRPIVLTELHKRFDKAGIKHYQSFIADLTNPVDENKSFNLIVCDAPCSGSGTWNRTPEQIFFFKAKKIDQFALLQQKIVTNVIPHLENNGYFLYITCSVFKKENESMVDFIKEKFSLQLIRMEVLKGYDVKADSMFVALFKKVDS